MLISCFFFVRYPFEHVSQIPPKSFCFTQRYQDVKKVLADTFFGPPDVGVYSPSVQNTLYLMAKEVLNRSVTLVWLLLAVTFSWSYLVLLAFLYTFTKYMCAFLRFPDIASVQLRMPNLHFIPVNLGNKENPGLVKVRIVALHLYCSVFLIFWVLSSQG